MSGITGVVHTKNSEKYLDECLASLKFVDTILVADMHSRDNSLKIAKKHKAKIIQIQDYGYVEPARIDSIKHVNTKWALYIDSDEIVYQDLADKIIELIHETNPADGYEIPRQNYVFQQWIKHTGWWPDYQLRLFKTDKVIFSKKIHEKPKINGKVKKIEANPKYSICHENYQTIRQFIEKLNQYTDFDNTTGKKINPVSSFFDEFFTRFFKHQAYKDGMAGIALSLLQSNYPLFQDLKKWQSHTFKETMSEKELIIQMFTIHKQMKYWLADYRVKNSQNLIQKIFWQIRRKYKI